MMWVEKEGEELYYDNLETAKLSIDPHINVGLDIVVDVDQYYSGVDETDEDQISYVAVGGRWWSVTRVVWTPATGDQSAEEVRADCTPTFQSDVFAGDFYHEEDYFTCVVKCRNGNFAIAGDSRGYMHLLNLTTGVDVWFAPVGPTDGPIQRIFETDNDTIMCWDKSGFVHWFVINKVTGVIGVVTSYDMTGLEAFVKMIDVCKSPDGTGFVFTILLVGSSRIYYISATDIRGAAAPTLYVADMIMQSTTLSITGIHTQPMAFIDNSHVIVLSNTYANIGGGIGNYMYLVDLNLAAPNGQLIGVDLPMAAYDAIGFTNNGEYGILTGRIQNTYQHNYMQQESIVVWKIVVSFGTQESTVTLTPLYRNRYDEHIDMIYRIFRMRKRHNSEQWFLISNEWGDDEQVEEIGTPRLMAVGEMTESPDPSVDSTTSTTITMSWGKPSELYSEENIAFVRIMRSETCEPDDWDCVFASGDLPCGYIDNQHPTISPRDIDDDPVTVEYVEVGLVDQVSVANGGAGEIHSFDPRLDTFPEGRPFYYKIQYVSYVGIVAESAVFKATTAKPIQPVHIDDDIPLFSEYDWTEPYSNLDIQSGEYTLNWDWIDLFDSTPESQFDRWEIAVFEEHDESTFYIEPYWGLGSVEFVFPWIYSGLAVWTCDRGGVITTPNTKSKRVQGLQNYDITTGDLYEWPIVPYTIYRNAIIGWDKGGLWRVSTTVTRGDDDWVATRQTVLVHTLPKPSGVIEIEDTDRERVYNVDTPEFLYKDWIAYDDGATFDGFDVGVVGAFNHVMAGQHFVSTQHHTIIGYRVYVSQIVGVPSALEIRIHEDVAGLPGVAIAGSVLQIPLADVVIGVNTVYFPYPTVFDEIYGRPYHVVVTTALGAGEPLGNNYVIGANVYLGETTYGAEYYSAFAWNESIDRDLRVGIICSGYASDSIVLNSGYVSTYHTTKTTDASMESLIYRDRFNVDTGNWDLYYGTVAPAFTMGYMEMVLGVGDSSYVRLDLDNIGPETRNYIVKFDVYMVAANMSFWVWLRTQTDYAVNNFTALRVGYGGMAGTWNIYQHHHSQAAGELLSAVAGIGLTADQWNTIIIAVIDGSVMLWTDTVADDAIDLFNVGNAMLKARIIDTDDYPFIDHGYPFIFAATDDGNTIRIDNFEIYGLPNSSDYSGGQGFFIDYGDDSESGYFSLDTIDKTYSVDPDDRIETFDLITHPINEFDQEDFGMPMVDMELYSSMTIDVKVVNSYPVASMVLPDIAYIDNTIYADLSGSFDPDGGELTYNIDWGDGTTDTGTTARFTHTYTRVGVYTVELYVTDELLQNSEIVYHTITIESILNDLYELIPNLGFESVSPSRANGSSTFNLPDKCGGETHATKGGSRKYEISGYHLDPCCCNNLIKEWTEVLSIDAVSSWVQSDGYNGGIAMQFAADHALFAYATQIMFRVSISKSADFDGDLEFRIVDGLNPLSLIFDRGQTQIIENADITVHDGDDHYIDVDFFGCPIDSYGNNLFLVVTPVNSSAGTYYMREGGSGNAYSKANTSNTWVLDLTSRIYMDISVYNDAFDMAICEHLLFDELHCEGNPFKLYIPGFGEKAVIMTSYSATKDSGSPKWMKYSMIVVEQSTEAITGV